ncbi:unnamed protein product, partial [Staurois parvus]
MQCNKPNPKLTQIHTTNVVRRAGSVANGQTGYQERVEKWSGIAEVRTGGVRSESGSKQEADRMQVQGLMGNIHQGTDHRPGP